MSRKSILAAVGVLLVGGAVLLGCPAAHDEYPGTSCKLDTDCFVNETCISMRCVSNGPDLSLDLAFPYYDLAHEVDGGSADGDVMPDLSEVDQ